TYLLALLYLLKGALYLMPPGLHQLQPLPLRLVHATADALMLIAIAEVRQILILITTFGWRPDRRWLALNYLPSFALCAIGVALQCFTPSPEVRRMLSSFGVASALFVGAMGVLMLRSIWRVARAGPWGAGIGAPRTRDMAVWTGALVLLGMAVVIALT